MASPHASPAPAHAARTLQPLPSGSLHWFDPARSDTLENRLYTALLRSGRPTALDAGTLAEQLEAPVRDVAAALFALNRTTSIALVAPAAQAPAPWAAYGLRALADDLAMMATPGQNLLLSSDDGLTIACIGWTAYEARVLAVRLRSAGPDNALAGNHYRLQFGRHLLHLTCSGTLDTASPTLLRLAFRLSFATEQTALPSSLDTPRP